MKTITVKQVAIFKTIPHEVYEALMDEEKHAAFTGGSARISREVGGSFNVFNGYAHGINEELVPDRKIVQISLPVLHPMHRRPVRNHRQ